jgi:hypothetical protein
MVRTGVSAVYLAIRADCMMVIRVGVRSVVAEAHAPGPGHAGSDGEIDAGPQAGDRVWNGVCCKAVAHEQNAHCARQRGGSRSKYQAEGCEERASKPSNRHFI